MYRLLRILGLVGLACALAACAQSPNADEKLAAARADADFQAGVDRTPTAATLYAMARVLAAQHRDDDCEILLRRILHDHAEFLPAYNELAELQLRNRRVDQALETLQSGLVRSPHNPLLLNNLGMCYHQKADYAAALQCFTEASAAEPANARYRANMAVALGLQGRYDEALALYQQILPLAEAYYNLGILAEARHDTAFAQDQFARAKTLSVTKDGAAPKD